MHTSNTLEIKSNVEDRVLSFETADGVLSKESFRESVLRLLEATEFSESDEILNVDSNYGVLGVLASGMVPDGEVMMTEDSARAGRLSSINAERNRAENVEIQVTPWVSDIDGSYNVAAYAPKPFDPQEMVKQKIVDGMSLLDESGRIIVSAHKNEGGNRYEEFLNEISNGVEVLSKSNGYRVVEAERPEDIDFDPRFETHSYTAEVDGIEATFRTVPGLFSEQGLDQGTRKLIENMEVNDGHEILDLGCGYGPVTAYAAKMADIDAVMTDDSALAAYYAQENMELNGIDAKVRNGDVLSEVEEEGFDRVLTNPPTHAGSDVTSEFFNASYDVLEEGGEMYLVYNDVMGYENDLQDIFSEVEVVDSSEGFNVTRARK